MSLPWWGWLVVGFTVNTVLTDLRDSLRHHRERRKAAASSVVTEHRTEDR